MESSSFNSDIIRTTIQQMLLAIGQISEWNDGIHCSDDFTSTPDGMKTLAASSMLIEAIGEGIKKLYHRTDGAIFQMRPDIPWREIMGMRNHIAHGYFDIDADLIYDVIKNELDPLTDALKHILENL